ncbi:MAG: tetratricopeptide repeat protein [Bacteroidales bacterium]|nr:tetratricopeptide repeat protein [Bacteroidales bacterium]
MLSRKTIYGALLALISVYGLVSCSVEKNTSLSRNYHNLTSHYNVYFNGYESYKQGIDKANKSIQNNYNQILDLFLYENESVHSAASGDMKRAIDKATKVITVHSITAKPKVQPGNQSARDRAFYDKNEYNKWADDSYLLMGKAYMHQGEFFLAAEAFNHILVTFPDEEIRYLAMIWLSRAYLMIDEEREAERILTALLDEAILPREYLSAYYTTRAQLHLKNQEYSAAAGQLELALGQRGVSREDKIRYTYILAQLYASSAQNNLALEKYKRVTRYNPPYEMAFNARVSMAEVFESGEVGSADLKKLLGKMLKDSKNLEYQDQIYFALGNISMEEGDREKAIEYYRLSVSASLQNQYQKGYSSLTLAEIFYEEPDYLQSAAYYDSAVTFLDRDYPGYAGLASLSASLDNLVYNVSSYELEDSVQMLAALPDEQRLAVIDGIIEELRKQEEEERLAEQEAMQEQAFNQSMLYGNDQRSGGRFNQPGVQTGGQWYFYNLNAKSFGQPEFRMKWGERVLEDNWRRKSKRTQSEMNPEQGAEADTLLGNGGTPVLDNKSREFYLINIPLTDSAKELSHQRLEEALYNMGVIYKEQLLDYEEALAVFKELIRRYPDTENGPSVYYYLYELSNNLQKPTEAQFYANQLSLSYPDSHFAKLLNNPNYPAELQEEEMRVVRFYEGIYRLYQEKDYGGVIAGADSALVLFEEDPLLPKFKYIRAMALGAVGGKEVMKVALDSLIAQHPSAEESLQAREIVEYMYVEFPEIMEADQAAEAEEVYGAIDSAGEHYVLLAVHSSQNVNQVSFDLLNHNLDYYNQYDLSIEQVQMADSYIVLLVKPFLNAEAASRYLADIEKNREVILKGIAFPQYRMMIISRDNFEILSEKKELVPYYLFFQKHYYP